MAYVKNTLLIMAHYHKTYPKCQEQQTLELYRVFHDLRTLLQEVIS